MNTKIMKNQDGKMMLCCDDFEMNLAKKRGYTIEGSFLEYFQSKDKTLKAEIRTYAEDEDGYYYSDGCYKAMEVMYRTVSDFEFKDYDEFYRLMMSWEDYDDAKGISKLMKQCKAEAEAMAKQIKALSEMFGTFEDLFKEIALNEEDLANELEEN